MKKMIVYFFLYTLSSLCVYDIPRNTITPYNRSSLSLTDRAKISGMTLLSSILIPCGLGSLLYSNYGIYKTKVKFLKSALNGNIDIEKFKRWQNIDEIKYVRSYHGKSLLHAAAKGGQLAFVQHLIENVQLHTYSAYQERTNTGETPLHIAAQEGHLPIVKYLVKHNFNIRALNNNNKTPWQLAEKDNKLNILQFITHRQIKQLQQEEDDNDMSCGICMENRSNTLCDYGCLNPICTTCKDRLNNPYCPYCNRSLSKNLSHNES